ncbi:MAG TPA: hypothetical protein VFT17_08400, partial [Propionibacteriaceae bacterium]|nr:hypothetical protein [Propionibacteriaceae bacterium]
MTLLISCPYLMVLILYPLQNARNRINTSRRPRAEQSLRAAGFEVFTWGAVPGLPLHRRSKHVAGDLSAQAERRLLRW